MVLTWRPRADADALVLDNLDDVLCPLSLRSDLQPRFSFNEAGVWQGLTDRSLGDPYRRLPVWREVCARAIAQGF